MTGAVGSCALSMTGFFAAGIFLFTCVCPGGKYEGCSGLLQVNGVSVHVVGMGAIYNDMQTVGGILWGGSLLRCTQHMRVKDLHAGCTVGMGQEMLITDRYGTQRGSRGSSSAFASACSDRWYLGVGEKLGAVDNGS